MRTDTQAVQGVIRNAGRKYANGLQPVEIWVPKESAEGLPFVLGRPSEVTLDIGGARYIAIIRSTVRNEYVWISPKLTNSTGQRTKLAAALKGHFAVNETVFLRVRDKTIIVSKPDEGVDATAVEEWRVKASEPVVRDSRAVHRGLVNLDRSTFATHFDRFCRGVEAYSGEPFESFDEGLPYDWEHYKEYVYDEARQRMSAGKWRKSEIGTGEILNRVISAIEIQGSEFRNNLVQWDRRYGEQNQSHSALLEARKRKGDRSDLELLLYRFYRGLESPAAAFEKFTQLVGKRYDLIAYLFFVQDCKQYMPVRPTHFTRAFERLGIPLPMVGLCSWDNYCAYLDRLRVVQEALRSAVGPRVRLIDAHSFCWMLVQPALVKTGRTPKAIVHSFDPVAGDPPTVGDKKGDEQPDFDAMAEERRRIGTLAQAIVLKAERDRLCSAGRSDLADRVQDVSEKAALGYDLDSFEENGRPKPIEVKAAARRGKSLRFFLTENERRKSRELENYTFALVLDPSSKSPTVREFKGNKLPDAALHPALYDVRLLAARE